ncbi:hypothetical protein B0O80DRAFT_151736 [Mortierella sp. GBAus27b]|nr:hypothetical protein B0O80DRAFT_151736 [Mortierella sp. GBAus27b]
MDTICLATRAIGKLLGRTTAILLTLLPLSCMRGPKGSQLHPWACRAPSLVPSPFLIVGGWRHSGPCKGGLSGRWHKELRLLTPNHRS